MSESPRVYVQQDGTIPSTCPACGAKRPLQADKIEICGRPVELRCSCGHRFSVFPEFRKAYRRKINLCGTYTKLSSEKEHGEILINNMSMTGVGFATAVNHCLSENNELSLRIRLDDDKDCEIEAVAVVIHVFDKFVGCRFKELSTHYEDKLVNYLMLIP